MLLILVENCKNFRINQGVGVYSPRKIDVVKKRVVYNLDVDEVLEFPRSLNGVLSIDEAIEFRQMKRYWSRDP